MAVNAFGDIYDWKTGQKIAGAHDEDGRLYDRTEMISYMRLIDEATAAAAESASAQGEEEQADEEYVTHSDEAAINTTIGIVFTNAPLQKPQLCKIAAMAHDGLARSIAPVHCTCDGDSIIALSVPSGPEGNPDKKPVIAGIDTVGSLASWAVSEAILRAVRSAESAYGLKALKDC